MFWHDRNLTWNLKNIMKNPFKTTFWKNYPQSRQIDSNGNYKDLMKEPFQVCFLEKWLSMQFLPNGGSTDTDQGVTRGNGQKKIHKLFFFGGGAWNIYFSLLIDKLYTLGRGLIFLPQTLYTPMKKGGGWPDSVQGRGWGQCNPIPRLRFYYLSLSRWLNQVI